MDSQGYVLFSFIAGFKRIQQLTDDLKLIRETCAQIPTIEYIRGDDGIERLRRREGWNQWIMSIDERDPSAQNAGPPKVRYLRKAEDTRCLEKSWTTQKVQLGWITDVSIDSEDDGLDWAIFKLDEAIAGHGSVFNTIRQAKLLPNVELSITRVAQDPWKQRSIYIPTSAKLVKGETSITPYFLRLMKGSKFVKTIVVRLDQALGAMYGTALCLYMHILIVY